MVAAYVAEEVEEVDEMVIGEEVVVALLAMEVDEMVTGEEEEEVVVALLAMEVGEVVKEMVGVLAMEAAQTVVAVVVVKRKGWWSEVVLELRY
jgi:hypothetical protein